MHLVDNDDDRIEVRITKINYREHGELTSNISIVNNLKVSSEDAGVSMRATPPDGTRQQMLKKCR